MKTDAPYKVVKYGKTVYYKDLKHTIVHNLDGAAIEFSDGEKYFCINGKMYNESDFKILVKKFKLEDHQQASDLLNI